MKKRVILTSNSSWYLYNFRKNTINSLLNSSYEVICIAPIDKYTKILENMGVNFFPLKLNRLSRNPLKEISVIIKLAFYFKKFDPYLIFSFTAKNNIYGSIASFITSRRIINNISGLGSAFIEKGLTQKIIIYLYRMIRNIPLHTFCQNQIDQEFLIKHKMLKSERSSVIPGSGVDINFFSRPLDKIKVSDSVRNFVFVGRLIAEKGIREILVVFSDLIKLFPEMRLNIIGIIDPQNPSSLSRQELESIRELPYINLIEGVDDVRKHLLESDCFILPSYREGLSRATLEAMSMEIPIICSDVPGLNELIDDGVNGYLCKPFSSNSLKDAVLRMINTDARNRYDFGKISRKKVMQNYDEKIVINSLFKFL